MSVLVQPLREGQVKRFGSDGDLYVILSAEPKELDGRQFVAVQVLATDEEFDYRLDDAINDPDA